MGIKKILPMVGKTREQQWLDEQELQRRLESRMPKEFIEAHKHCFKNREELLASEAVGCFHCLDSFPPSEIEEWHDDDATGFCPKCGIDALIGSSSGIRLDSEFLREMKKYWFDNTVTLK